MNKANLIFTPKRNKLFKKKRFNTKNNTNNSARYMEKFPDKKYQSFLTKNRRTFNNDFNYNSHKNVLSLNILNRIQTVKQNTIKNELFRAIKVKYSTKTNYSNSSNNINKIKSPIINNEKSNIFQKYNEESKKKMNDEGGSSFSIKVNKNIKNNKEIKVKNKNKNLIKARTNTSNKIKKRNNTHNNVIKE